MRSGCSLSLIFYIGILYLREMFICFLVNNNFGYVG
jgi:hypothetical protein